MVTKIKPQGKAVVLYDTPNRARQIRNPPRLILAKCLRFVLNKTPNLENAPTTDSECPRHPDGEAEGGRGREESVLHDPTPCKENATWGYLCDNGIADIAELRRGRPICS